MQTLRGEIENTSVDLQKQRHYGTTSNDTPQAICQRKHSMNSHGI